MLKPNSYRQHHALFEWIDNQKAVKDVVTKFGLVTKYTFAPNYQNCCICLENSLIIVEELLDNQKVTVT